MFILDTNKGAFEEQSESDLINSFINFCIENDCYRSIQEIIQVDDAGELVKKYSVDELREFESEANSEIKEGLLMATGEYTTTRDLEREYKSNLL